MSEIEFHKELESLQIHFPGGNIVNFNDDQALLDFLKQQYPTWKNKGIVTSIPIARIPRLFLHCHQIIEPLDKRYKGLEKGEHGEVKVYNELLKLRDQCESGLCVFPNVDGNNFSSKEAHVEIDMVVVHPLKGIFVISIKNTTTIKTKEVTNNIEKHVNFIRLLCTFGHKTLEKPSSQYSPENSGSQFKSDANCCTDNEEWMKPTQKVPVVEKNSLLNKKHDDVAQRVPIHGIIMSHRIEIKRKALRDYFACQENGFRYFFQPDDMDNFQSKWISILSDIPNISDMVVQSQIELLTARLTALNSMEGSLALIHNRMNSNKLQEMKFSKNQDKLNVLEKQFPNNDFKEEIKATYDELLSADGSSKNISKSIILWTKEQLEVINVIIKSISKSKGCRIIVTGPRGSGKTMLLVFIAKLAKKIFQNDHKDDTDGNVVVRDGRLGSSLLLFEKLKEKFFNTGIDVVTNKDKDNSKRRLILVDETNFLFLEKFPEKFSKSQHVVFFTSQQKFSESNKDFVHLRLTHTLRSTVQLTTFIESFRHQDQLNIHLEAMSVHNFQGSEPNIKYVDSNNVEDANHYKFVELCTSTILDRLACGKGLKEILVTPYVHPITLNRILSNLQRMKVDFHYHHPYEELSMFQLLRKKETGYSNADQLSSNASSKKSADVVIATGNHIDGVEFGSVIIFLDHSLPVWWDNFIFDSLYIAMTRATTDLVIVINNNEEPPMIKTSHKSKTKFLNEEFGLSAFSLIPTSVNNYPRKVNDIIEDSYWSKDPVLIVGDHVPSNAISVSIDDFNWKTLKDPKHNEVWYTLAGDKQVVIHPNFDSLSSSFCQPCNIYNKAPHRYSAMIFICQSLYDYENLQNSMVRHKLMYHFYEFQLSDCPIYLLINNPPPVLRVHSPVTCAYLINIFESESIDYPSSSEDSEIKEFSWILLKEKGTDFFRSGDLLSALSYYKRSLSSLQNDCDDVIHLEKVQTLIPIFEDLSYLCTNISKVLFELAKTIETGAQRNRMVQESLEFAEKSVEMNPCWRKGFYRIAEANELLNENIKAEEARNESRSICNYAENITKKKKRAVILNHKLKTSPSWSLIKHKENVFLIDQDPDKGHFTSVKDALDMLGREPVSFVINPGIYYCSYYLDKGLDVDIVGNWNAVVCHENNWLLEESPVIIRPRYPSLIFFVRGKAKLSLSRVTLYNENHHTVDVAEKSSVSLFQCFFSSKNIAAISCFDESSLSVQSCWSQDSFSSVLGGNKSHIDIVHSYFFGTEMVGLEFREDVTVNIVNCSIAQCKMQGVLGTRCSKVSISSCNFEKNGINKTDNEGSIQMRETIVEIKDTCIQNQISHGIVIEFGRGTFECLNIHHCKASGILAQAPCIISNCSFTKCNISAVSICDNIHGDIIMQDNTIKQSSYEVSMASSKAPFPIVNGERWSAKKGKKQLFILSKKMQKKAEIDFRKGDHEKVVSNHDMIRKCLELWPDKYQSVDPMKNAFCHYCTLPVDINPLNWDHLLCKGCELYFYCNIECSRKHSDIHRYECERARKSIDNYRKKIGWKGSK